MIKNCAFMPLKHGEVKKGDKESLSPRICGEGSVLMCLDKRLVINFPVAVIMCSCRSLRNTGAGEVHGCTKGEVHAHQSCYRAFWASGKEEKTPSFVWKMGLICIYSCTAASWASWCAFIVTTKTKEGKTCFCLPFLTPCALLLQCIYSSAEELLFCSAHVEG